ncbi:Rne/Rng family ribonuclease [Oryzifoliimicrobium ureilyticus]|uniref:Rne/Rng family ribonuclease n=1 Tax=Oryzifoliimicrobium ureilyticus TaxID=3113724 RepID=UPI00307616C7
MADKMLIDASHEEETRVVVVRGNRIEEFDFESEHKKQIRGNIYLAKVTRVEPSLQAAFVDYGGNRHGFLAFAEIHPDYYQIPLADRQALLRAEAEENRRDDDIEHVETARPDPATQDQPDVGIVSRDAADDAKQAEAAPEKEASAEAVATEQPEAVETSALSEVEVTEEPAAPAKKKRAPAKPRRSRKKVAEEATAADASADVSEEQPATPSDDHSSEGGDDGDTGGKSMAAMVETDTVSEDVDVAKRHAEDDDDDDHDQEEEVIESVGAEDAMEEVPDRVVRKPRKQYRIQEVIKRRQILLVQVAKEERGNKGAALTTYLSLAGRYSVLMPNTARGGGISRKITNPADRKRLKEVARILEVPQGMGVILRTAGANRTKVEIKRDFEYLMRLWENVRTLTLASTAPCLVYEEGSLIKRSIRDLYNKDISEIVVAGEDGYREAKDFMKMLMPSHAKVVQPYRDIHPIFSRSGIEAQLDRMLQPQVTLKSGGYLIINQTEALVAIDVNSGRSTREHSIEDTALQTNLEAAEEIARQLRLRDLAGLIVIDFIDMEEKRNNRAVEKKLKECLKNDRARIQVGRISHFGLLEMSRQRIRASVLESTTQVCQHCGGTGHVRSQSSIALHVLRGVEEYLLKNTTHDIKVRMTPDIALYLLNYKRQTIVDYEARFGVAILIDADATVGSQHFAIDRGEPVENPVKIETLFNFAPIEDEDDDIVIEADEDEEDIEEKEAPVEQARSESDGEGDGNNRKRKRRRRRRGRNNGNPEQTAGAAEDTTSDESSDDDEGDGEDEAAPTSESVTAGEPVEATESEENNRRKRRRRGKRGGRRNREEGGELSAEGGDDGEDSDTPEAVVTASKDAEPANSLPSELVASEPVTEEAPVEAKRPSKSARQARLKEERNIGESAPPQSVEDTSTQTDQAGSEEPKTARANRGSNISSSEPTVTSTRTEGEPEGKPKKVGWWQRRGFL